MTDPQLEAFRRLLQHSSSSEQAKLDAVVALSQRTVLVACWPHDEQALRTLLNSQHATALPVFTEEALVRAAARRFGWLSPDGSVPMKEMGAREAFRYAIMNDVGFVVVDITEPHSIEVDHAEMQPFFASKNRRETSGPFAVVGLDSSAYRPVKESTVSAHKSAPPPAMSVDDLLDEVTVLLRNYPEVEWGVVIRKPDADHSTIALRIDPSFSQRTPEILHALGRVLEGSGLTPMVVDSAEATREARANGIAFYPWRKK